MALPMQLATMLAHAATSVPSASSATLETLELSSSASAVESEGPVSGVAVEALSAVEPPSREGSGALPRSEIESEDPNLGVAANVASLATPSSRSSSTSTTRQHAIIILATELGASLLKAGLATRKRRSVARAKQT